MIDFREALRSVCLTDPCGVLPNTLWKTLLEAGKCLSSVQANNSQITSLQTVGPDPAPGCVVEECANAKERPNPPSARSSCSAPRSAAAFAFRGSLFAARPILPAVPPVAEYYTATDSS